MSSLNRLADVVGRAVLVLVAGVLLVAATLPIGALAQPSDAVTCVRRTASATPPPLPHLPAAGQGTGSVRQPVCPPGMVPAIKAMKPAQAGLVKGNPALGNVVLRQAGPGSVTAPSCLGLFWYGACYYYADARYDPGHNILPTTVVGGGMITSIAQPTVVGQGHSLDEIAVEGGSKHDNIVELGWNVAPAQYSDAAPHLFVSHWINGNWVCYDDCGWQQWSNVYYPGQDLSTLVNRDVYLGYVFWQGNWWAWFDNLWLGYFPGSEWSGSFTRATLLEWFGEVATLSGIPPQTQMGTGVLPASSSAAHMSALCEVDAFPGDCWIRNKQSLLTIAPPNWYEIATVGFGATRYGGPGQ
jgi:hypothetical protein